MGLQPKEHFCVSLHARIKDTVHAHGAGSPKEPGRDAGTRFAASARNSPPCRRSCRQSGICSVRRMSATKGALIITYTILGFLIISILQYILKPILTMAPIIRCCLCSALHSSKKPFLCSFSPETPISFNEGIYLNFIVGSLI